MGSDRPHGGVEPGRLEQGRHVRHPFLPAIGQQLQIGQEVGPDGGGLARVGAARLEPALPWVLGASALALVVTEVRTQRRIWKLDMANKAGAAGAA